MIDPVDERRVIAVAEGSAAIALTERLAARLRAAGATSRLVALGRSVARETTGRIGAIVVVAVITHVTLVVAVAPPTSGYWLILPAVFAAAGALLIAARR